MSFKCLMEEVMIPWTSTSQRFLTSFTIKPSMSTLQNLFADMGFVRVAEKLIGAGAEVNFKKQRFSAYVDTSLIYEDTPLIASVKGGSSTTYPMASFLIANGADISLKNSAGVTALDAANSLFTWPTPELVCLLGGKPEEKAEGEDEDNEDSGLGFGGMFA